MRTKINRGFYPIAYSDLKRMIGYCEKWGYGNKETCKYVAENTIEQIALKNPHLKIREDLYQELVELTHDINNGRVTKGQLLIKL
jgi:hypothetical protein